MVVMVILVILMGIGLAVANQVTQGGKIRSTQALIRTLDQVVMEYQASSGGKVPGNARDAENNEFPIVDGRFAALSGPNDPAVPSQALFMAAIRTSPSALVLLKGIDPQLTQRITDIGIPGVGLFKFRAGAIPAAADREGVVVIKDAFGQPIRFVHPKYHGGFGDFWRRTGAYTGSPAMRATTRELLSTNIRTGNAVVTVEFRRAALPVYDTAINPDSDAWNATGDGDEGLCPGGLPYFYSSGPDKDPGRRIDNIYTTVPTFPVESMSASGV